MSRFGVPSPHETADICLIVEGCYPYVAGGVSSWLDWLMRSMPDKRFAVVAIVAADQSRKPRYDFPPNLLSFQEIVIGGAGNKPGRGSLPPASLCGSLAEELVGLVEEGSLARFAAIERLVNDPAAPVPLDVLLRSELSWDLCKSVYRRLMPNGSFKDFFWAWHALMDGLFSVLKADLPEACTYHTISTGYAGLVAARAKARGAARTIITEHGIYTTERRIEILMAPWIVDTIDKGMSLRDGRLDIRDLWIKVFESYARCCYQACDAITTLFGDNQPMQRASGAPEARLKVIANGIDVERFASVGPLPDEPAIALVGRVVPIKDIRTFIRTVEIARRSVPGLRAYIAGPEDEDPPYAAQCRALVDRLGLSRTVTFLGRVDVRQLLDTVRVVVLTSLSEAQPLTVLEAGAAGRPCVTTDVGSCRELIEGMADENPAFGAGGMVVGIARPDECAAAIVHLLTRPDVCAGMGEALRGRVRAHYTSQQSSGRYRRLYDAVPEEAA